MIPAFAALLFAFAAGLLLTPVARAFARRIGFVAKPSSDRWHQAPTAMLGGAAIVAATVLGVVASRPFWGSNWPDVGKVGIASSAALGVLATAALMFVVGVVDDRVRLRAQTKFVLQILGGTVLVASGAVFHVTPWFIANVVVTVFWFVAITNAFNLLDNMDGVAAGVAAVAAIFLGILNARSGALVHAIAAWALAGASLGFLRYNFSPASIFMGDAGSLFVGAVVAGLFVSSPITSSGRAASLLLVAVTLVAVPVLDTALVSITRILGGRRISQGGRDHSAHRLVALGLGERQVALLLYAVAILGGFVALALTRLDGGMAILLGTCFLTMLALLAAYTARMKIGFADKPLGWRRAAELAADVFYKRRLGEVLLDAVLVTVAYYGAYRLRFDSVPPAPYQATFDASVGLVIALKIVTFAGFGVYRGAWRYSSIVDIYRVIAGVVVSSTALFVAGTWQFDTLRHSHSIIIIDALLTAGLVLAARLSFRSLDTMRKHLAATGIRTLIYGAGDGGEMALREIWNNRTLGLTPICFLDDDPRTHGTQIHGVAVEGGWSDLSATVERHGIRRIVLGTKKLPQERLEALEIFAFDSDIEIVELDLQFRPLANGRHPERKSARAPTRVGVA